MGTNFYWKKLPIDLEPYKDTVDMTDNNNILMHIGKRSAAGLYCLDCGCTFHKYGTDHIHGEYNPHSFFDKEKYNTELKTYWYDKCPVCGKDGTNICTFRWTFLKQKEIIEDMSIGEIYYEKRHEPIPKVIVDEYGQEYTATEFLIDIQIPNTTVGTVVEYQTANRFS